MSDLSEKNSYICGKQQSLGATHVVTQVKTGFNANLVFEIDASKTVTKKELSGSLSIQVKKLAFKVSGEATLNVTDSEKDIQNKLKFRFHGDATINPPPATYAVSILVWLTERKLPFANGDVFCKTANFTI